MTSVLLLYKQEVNVSPLWLAWKRRLDRPLAVNGICPSKMPYRGVLPALRRRSARRLRYILLALDRGLLQDVFNVYSHKDSKHEKTIRANIPHFNTIGGKNEHH